MKFSKEDAQKISGIIGCDDVTYHQDHYHLRIFNAEEKRELKLEVYPETALGESRGMLVVVYTGNSHLQLHNCSGYVTSEDLGEVTFVAETENRLSGLVVERGASCSLYAALNRELISSDFTQLGVEVMLGGVSLSLTEQILSDQDDKTAKD